MKRYDSYKDSGVEWIGDTPSGWSQTKMKYVGDYINGYPFKPSDWGDTGRLIIRIQNLTKGRGSENFYDGEIDSKYIIKTGDYLFSWSTTLGLFEWKREEGVLNQHIFKVELNDILTRKFYYWVIQGVIKELSNESHGSTMTHLTKDVFGNIRLPLPPLSEQHQIVSYLDTKTSLIDSLIEKTQRKIELLKEKRTSLINEVVTKGLNPNVEMKYSGVEWIGEIPSHWELRKGSTIGNYSKGKGIKKDEVKETGLPCIRYGEIYTKYNHKFESVETFIDEGVTDIKVKKGTLFMTGSGELLEDIGKCVVYVGNGEIYVGGDIIILKPFNEFDSEFLSYQINSECIRIQREQNGRGGIIVHIYSKNFKDMWFPTPPTSEQQKIVDYLDEQTQLIDKTVSIEEKRIELLKEYRQSLISEVVTGKLKVTN